MALLTKNNLWLRRRNNTFEIQHDIISEEEEGEPILTPHSEQRFRKIREIIQQHTDITLHAIARDSSHHDFERILADSVIIPFAKIHTIRTSFTFTLDVGPNHLHLVNNAIKHKATVHIDKALLQDAPSVLKTKYVVAELQITRNGGGLDVEDATRDVLQLLDLNREMTKNVRSKITECIKLNDPHLYDKLVHHKIIDDPTHNVNPDSLIDKVLGEDVEAFVKAFNRVHGNGNLHFGVTRTFNAFNLYYPNHNIPYEVFQEAIRTCATCQAYRNRYLTGFKEVAKVIKPKKMRHSIGIDRVTITPATPRGNKTLIVIGIMFTKLIFANPAVEYDAISIARSLLIFYSLYGKFDICRSDAGSDILAQVVDQLLIWLGDIDRIVAIVGRAQSSGIERSNGKILEHLGMICSDQRNKDDWDLPEKLNLILFKLNNSYNEETNMSAFTATFGDHNEEYFKFALTTNSKPADYISQLHNNMKLINEITTEYQQKLINDRLAPNPPTQLVNRFKKNDLVLLKNRKIFKDYKLDPSYLGPFLVTRDQITNDVHIQHAATGATDIVFVTELTHFHPSSLDDRPPLVQAREAAELDSNQLLIDKIIDIKGDPNKRSDLSFQVRFVNSTTNWIPFSQDIFTTIHYENFIKERMIKHTYLQHLVYTTKEWKDKMKELNAKPIEHLPKNTTTFTYLSSYDYNWYHQLNLPYTDTKQYMVKLTCQGHDNKALTKVKLYCPIFKEYYSASQEYLLLYTVRNINDEDHILIDNNILQTFPQILRK
jgi:hypothetical protein